jgi:hypothetical protein
MDSISVLLDWRIDYEDFALDRCGVEEERKYQIRCLQIGVDPFDMHKLVETENLGDNEDVTIHPARIVSFPKLKRLELLVARTDVDEEDIRCENYGRKFSWEEVQEAKEYFDKVMRKKNPDVKVAYTDFESSEDMRRYWKAATRFD